MISSGRGERQEKEGERKGARPTLFSRGLAHTKTHLLKIGLQLLRL